MKLKNKKIIIGFMAVALVGSASVYFMQDIVNGGSELEKDPVPISTLAAGDPTPEAAFTSISDGYGGIKITAYDASKNPNHPALSIPSIIGGKTVTSVGLAAFSGKQLQSVEIPVGVTSIGEQAFYNNQLTSVTIPEGVTSIHDLAFGNNKLTSVTIPNSVTSLSGFNGNLLTSVTIPAGVTSIGANAFAGSPYGTPTNQITSVTIPAGVTSIGRDAFSNNKLTTVSIPASVTSIGDSAFAGADSGTPTNQLTSVTIPYGVVSIGDKAFSNNKLTTVSIPASVTSIGNSAFAGSTSSMPTNQLTSVTIPYGVVSIGDKAFLKNQLTSIEIPNSVTSIGTSAFESNRLTSVTISDRVTSIKDYTFAYNQLTSVEIPNSVTSLSGFNNNLLQSVEIPAGVTSIGMEAFSVNQLTSIEMASTVTSIGTSAFDSNRLTSVEIPAKVTSIGTSAFRNNQLTSVTISDGVASIGSQAFLNNKLTSLSIPGSVTSIAGSAFSKNKLTTLTLHDGLDSIGASAFEGSFRGNTGFVLTNQLTSIEIPSTVTSIGANAFFYNQLTSVTMYDAVTSIGANAFAGNKLESVEIPAGVTSIEREVFTSNRLTSIEIPAGVTSIGQDAFSNNKLTSIEIPAGVTSIGGSAFYYNQLQSVKLPSSVTTVGGNAFNNQKLTVPYRLEGGKYTVKLPDDIDMSKVTLAQNSGYTLDSGKKEAISSTQTNLVYDYAVPYGTAGQTAILGVDATLGGVTEFTVTYLGINGIGEPALKTEKVTENAKATPPTPPLVDWFKFTGWDPDITAPITKHTTFTALYTAVAKPTPTAGDFIYAAPTNLTYDKTPKTATVTAKTATEAEIGTITIKYAKETSPGIYGTLDGTAPITPGKYKVYIDVSGGTNYVQAAGLTAPSWEFTIGKGTLTPDKPTGLTAEEGQTLQDVVGSMIVTDGIWMWQNPGESVGTSGTNSFSATFMPTDTNYNEVKGTLDVVVVKPTPTISDFEYKEPTNLIYDTTEKIATVTAKTPVIGMGDITVKYAKEASPGIYDPSDDAAPIAPGTYKVSIDVAEGTIYKAINDLTDPSWRFTIDKATLTISDFEYKEPTNLIYDTTEKIATVTTKAPLIGMGDITVKYAKKTNDGTYRRSITTAPTDSGAYEISIDVAEGTNYKAVVGLTDPSWRFMIDKATLTISDFEYKEPTNLIYDKTEKIATVTTKAPVIGMGDITIKYTQKHGQSITTAPTDSGEYEVSIDVAESTNHKAVIGLTGPGWEFAISKGTLTPAKPSLTATEGQILSDLVLSMGVADGNWTWDIDGTTSVGVAGENDFPATFTPTDTNYNAVQGTLTVKVLTKTEPTDPVDPIDPPKPGDPNNPGNSGGTNPGDSNNSGGINSNGSGVTNSGGQGGSINFFSTGDTMNQTIRYGLFLLLAVLGIRTCVSKRKSK